MRTPKIYCNTDLAIGITVELPSDKQHHVQNVLRRKLDDEIILFNGLGGNYSGNIISLTKKSLSIKITGFDSDEPTKEFKINLAIGMIKPDKMDLVIQKAVELGVHSITPFRAKRSNIGLNKSRLENKLRHWNEVAIHSAEQSGRTKLATIHPLSDIDKWLSESHTIPTIYLHPMADKSLKELDIQSQVNIIIGPEGGFDDVEIALLEQSGTIGIKLGSRILRADTASIAIVSILQHQFGEFN